MDTITHQMRLANWLPIVRECRTSGLTVKAWCEQNNVNEKQFYYWQRRVRMEAIDSIQLSAQNSEKRFIELQPPVSKKMEPFGQAPDVILHTASCRFDIHNSISAELLEQILKVIPHAK